MTAPDPIWQDALESIAGDVVRTLDEREGENLVSAVLYGSVARGEAGVGSDVDLLFVFRDLPARRRERNARFWAAVDAHAARLDDLHRRGIDFDWSPTLRTVEEARHRSPLYLDMTLDARLLLDRGDFFAGILDALRARLRQLGSRRIPLPDGSWYWDLKPDWKPGEVVEV